MKYNVDIKPELCTGCGLCTTLCPSGAITVIGQKASIDRSFCIGCGQCICCCPKEAVCSAAHICGSNDYTPFQRLILTRHSCRSYLKDSVPEQFLRYLQTVPERCPSAMNQKTVRLIIIKNKDDISGLSRKISRLLCILLGIAVLPGINLITKAVLGKNYQRVINYRMILSDESKDRIFFDAPYLAIAVYKKGTVMGAEDAHIAAHTCMLACHDMGLGTCYIGLAENLLFLPWLRKAAGIPHGMKAASCFVFGKKSYSYSRHIDFTEEAQ